MPHFRAAGGYQILIQQQVRDVWDNSKFTVKWNTANGQVSAYIIESKWVADCPHCTATSVVQLDSPFFCPACAMQGNEFNPSLIVLPALRSEIEHLLLARPNPANRNWLLSESVADLRRENKEHGV
jgi:hypothetical protein